MSQVNMQGYQGEMQMTQAAKKRKPDEEATVASVLLSLDQRSNSKRFRPATPPAESREVFNPAVEEYRDERDDGEADRDDRTSSSKLSRRFMNRFEDASANSSPDVNIKRNDSNELASAMALASLAHHSPVEVRRSGSFSRQRSYGEFQGKPTLTAEQMSRMAIPSFHNQNPPSMYGGYYDNSPYGYNSNMYQRTPSQNWACDYCNDASFISYEEACRHEAICSYNPVVQQRHTHTMMRPSLPSRSVSMTSVGSASMRSTAEMSTATSPADDDDSQYFTGKIPLCVTKADPEWLSEMNCYIRKNCVEAFSADSEDVIKSSKRGRISLKQVGIRCVFCTHQDIEERVMSAVSYPVSSSGIYESVKRWIKIHLPLCKHIPTDVKEKIAALEKVAFIPTTRQYWIDSAKALGIQDTRSGLRFTHDIQDSNNEDKAATILLTSKAKKQTQTNKKNSKPMQIAKGGHIVYPDDEAVITPFLFMLLSQVEPCQFTDADRYIARSKCDTGFNGFQCRHCSGHAGLGKYFPTSLKALSTNSTSQNIFSHLLKCRKCPEDVKEGLKKLKAEKGHWTRRTTGWRQRFFEQVWKRLHGEDGP